MIVYRLCKAAYSALDGEGARRYGGRWNSPGGAMIYTAATASLAVLEVLVHLDLPVDLMPDDYRLLAIDVADDQPMQSLDRGLSEPAACRRIGDDFLQRGEALALLAPSVIVPQERNVLINIAHPGMKRVRITSSEAFVIDPRLIAST